MQQPVIIIRKRLKNALHIAMVANAEELPELQLLCENVKTHVTALLIHRYLLAAQALLIVVDVHHSCYNGLEVELQSGLQIIHSCTPGELLSRCVSRWTDCGRHKVKCCMIRLRRVCSQLNLQKSWQLP